MDQGVAGPASITIRLTVTVFPCVHLHLRQILRHGRRTAALPRNLRSPFHSRGRTNRAFPSTTNRPLRAVLFKNSRRRLRRNSRMSKRFRSSVGCVDGRRKEPTMSIPSCRLLWSAQSNKQRLCRCRRTADQDLGSKAMARHIPASNPAPSPPTLRSQFRLAPDNQAGRAATTTTNGENRMRWPLSRRIIVATEAMSISCITKPSPTILNFSTAIRSNCRDQRGGTWSRTNGNCGLRSWNLGMWSFTRALSAIKANKNLLRYLFIM